MKPQTPDPKLQRNSKLPISNHQARSRFGARCLKIFWGLALGASPFTTSAQPIVYEGTNAATGLGQLRVINSDGTGDRLLPVALPDPAFPSFSKDGRFMAITSKTPGRPGQ